MAFFLITALMLHFSLSYSVTVEQFYPFGSEIDDYHFLSYDGIYMSFVNNDVFLQLPSPITMLLENRGEEVSIFSVSVYKYEHEMDMSLWATITQQLLSSRHV